MSSYSVNGRYNSAWSTVLKCAAGPESRFHRPCDPASDSSPLPHRSTGTWNPTRVAGVSKRKHSACVLFTLRAAAVFAHPKHTFAIVVAPGMYGRRLTARTYRSKLL